MAMVCSHRGNVWPWCVHIDVKHMLHGTCIKIDGGGGGG